MTLLSSEFTKILLLSPIGDLLETHRRPTCLTHLRPWLASSETNMPNWRPKCSIEDWHACLSAESNRDSNIHMCLRLGMHCILVSDKECWSPMGHVGFKRVSYEAYWGLRSGMLVFAGSPIRHDGLRWVSNNNNIFMNSFQAYKFRVNYETSELIGLKVSKSWLAEISFRVFLNLSPTLKIDLLYQILILPELSSL